MPDSEDKTLTFKGRLRSSEKTCNSVPQDRVRQPRWLKSPRRVAHRWAQRTRPGKWTGFGHGRRGDQTAEQARVGRSDKHLYESYPGLSGEERWERLIAEDGQPVPVEDLTAQNRKREEAVRSATRRQARDPEAAREQQVRAWEEYRRETTGTVE